MINGQLNAVAMPTVTPSVMQNARVSNATVASETQQGREGFAGMLNEMQSDAKTKELLDSGQTGQPVLDAGVDNQVVALLAVLPTTSSTSEAVGTKKGNSEKAVAIDEDVSPHSEVADLVSQMVISVYAHSGRMPEANTTVSLTVDTLQNVAPVSEQRTAISVSSVEMQSVTPLQSLKSDRTSEVNNMTEFPAEMLQKVAAAAENPGLASSSTEKNYGEQVVVEAVKTPLVLSPPTVIQIPDEPNVLQDASNDDQQVLSGESLSARLVGSVPMQSAESELDIQLSQPQPITAKPTAVAVLTGSRSVASLQGNGAGQQLNPEQQIEKVRTGDEHTDVKEMASALLPAESTTESTIGSGSSQGGESNQRQSDSATDNQMLAQNMRVQSGSEHQKVFKAVSDAPVRQDAPAQIVQQVKEHLQLHDVKPGSQQITLTLSPDSLGELKMNLNLQGQKLSVEIVTENRSVRDVIIQHTDALKESLARQNITMESFDVTTGGKGSGNQGQNQNAWRELAQQQQQQSWVTPRGYQLGQADLLTEHTEYQRQQGQSMLDIHY